MGEYGHMEGTNVQPNIIGHLMGHRYKWLSTGHMVGPLVQRRIM